MAITQKDENSFTPMFLASLSDLALVVLQHELRRFPADRAHLDAVLAELAKRTTR